MQCSFTVRDFSKQISTLYSASTVPEKWHAFWIVITERIWSLMQFVENELLIDRLSLNIKFFNKISHLSVMNTNIFGWT